MPFMNGGLDFVHVASARPNPPAGLFGQDAEPTMTDAPDAIGPDGTVRLRCYLPSADSVWFLASCDGLVSCGHVAPIGIRAAVRLMGSGLATETQSGSASGPQFDQPFLRRRQRHGGSGA